VLANPLLLTVHPQHRLQAGVSLSVGVYCPDLTQPSLPLGNWCTPRLRLAVEGFFADFHLALLAGPTLDVGGQIGFELGTPYFQLGGRTGHVALAIRTTLDGTIAHLHEAVPGLPSDGILGFGNSYGPNLSIAIGRYALQARLAVGWTVNSFFNGNEIQNPIYSLLIEGWIGVRFQP
jgi:hypothetical protein